MNILSKRKLNGLKLNNLTTNDIKILVQSEFKRFMTVDTINITFELFDEWRSKYADDIGSKYAAEIGYIIYNFPLQNLLELITNNNINGIVYMDHFKNNEEFIKKSTGWNKNEIHQIQATLFKHQSFSRNEFVNNMNRIGFGLDGETFLDQLYLFTKSNNKLTQSMIIELNRYCDENEYDTDAIEADLYCLTNSNISNDIKNNFLMDLAKQSLRKYAKPLPHAIKTQISRTILQFDVEQLQLKISQGMNIDEFSNQIVKLVDNLTQINEENKRKDNNAAYCEDDFISRIYETIANCFVQNHYFVDNDIYHESSGRRYDWVCYNCGNNNFAFVIGSKVNIDISTCCLCGVQQKDSIALKLRNYDSFIMSTNIHTDNDIDTMKDNIDAMINSVIKHKKIDLLCLNKNDNKQCTSIRRLAKYLIRFKRWYYTIAGGKSDDINKTIQVDIGKYVNNDTFHEIFIASVNSVKKITQNDAKKLTTMIKDNIDNIGDIKTFTNPNMERKVFIKIIEAHTKIKGIISGKLYNKITKSLKRKARLQKFEMFVANVDIELINKDYYHILKSHINDGNKETMKNVFRFFATVVHYEDTSAEIEECGSFNRRQHRVNDMNLQTIIDNTNDKDNNVFETETKNISALKQYHCQSQVDVIHTYLVHSNWKLLMQRYVNQHDEGKEYVDDIDLLNVSNPNAIQNKEKYVSDYGFGVGIEYPHILPKFDSIRDEMLYNSAWSIKDDQFQKLLIKAISLHKIAVSDENKFERICKYYNNEYRLIRNEPIGIKHILSIIIYTNLTHFCRAFRSTYRKNSNEINEQQVIARHRELYYYARAIYEAVEFFGTSMPPGLKVYHGLNKVMCFDQFAAYFNHPISTTTSFKVAQEFADSKGIILTLQSGTQDFDDPRKIPKYLSVTWLSCFQNEDEKLFYGAFIRFKIQNITESENLKGHASELLLFNIFQKMITNQHVKWDETNEKHRKQIRTLTVLIKKQQNLDIVPQVEENKQYEKIEDKKSLKLKHVKITKYGEQLFHYFCTKTTQITIKDIKSFPIEIYNALFVEGTGRELSLIPITKLFPCLQEITFNDLNINDFTVQSKHYVDAAMEYININAGQMNLERIRFESKREHAAKINSTLEQLANKNSNQFDILQWKIKYRLQATHNLTITNYPYANIKHIKDCNNEQMIRLVIESCNKSDILTEKKKIFVSWFRENDIDGCKLISFEKNDFAQ
eukprot:7563_1